MSQAHSTRVRSHRTEETTDRAEQTTDRTEQTAEGTEAEREATETPVDECPECGGRTRVDAAERVCIDCGLVVDADRIDHGPAWRSFDDDDANPKRTGAPLTSSRHDRGLSTEIG